MFAKAMLGMVVYLGTIFYTYSVNPIWCTWTLIAPFFIVGAIMMFGNFSQHIFVQPKIATIKQDLKSVEYNCALTIQCMNHPDN